MEHLSHFVKAAQRKQHQDGFGFLVDLWGAQVFRPALQNIRALSWAQTHLETNMHDTKTDEMTQKRPQMLQKLYQFWMQSYLSQPGSAVPLPVGLQVAASIGCLVNQTQQLHPLWQTARENLYTGDREKQEPITQHWLDLIWKMN